MSGPTLLVEILADEVIALDLWARPPQLACRVDRHGVGLVFTAARRSARFGVHFLSPLCIPREHLLQNLRADSCSSKTRILILKTEAH